MAITLSRVNQIASPAGGFEPQRVHNFTLEIDLTRLSLGGLAAAESIQMGMRAFPFPSSNSEPIEVPWVNTVRKVAGKGTFENYEMVLTDYVDADVADILHRWRLKVYDPTTNTVGWAKDYKTSATILLFGPDGTRERKATLQGMWPSVLKLGDGNYDSNETNQITVTFVIDYWDDAVLTGSQGATGAASVTTPETLAPAS